MTVAELLAASRAQHLAYRTEQRKAPAADYGICRTCVAQALALRLEAHALDPSHDDPAWSGDKAPHEAIVAFFESFPTLHPA